MTTQPRIRFDDLTSDALDQLYEQLEQAELDAEQQDRHFRTICGERESYRQAWKDEQKQRATAEARVRELEANTATLQDALAAVTGQCRGLETQFATARSTIDRVRDLAGRYQMWHGGGWAPSSAAEVAREYRAVVDGRPDAAGNTPPAVRS